jgi:hypothetical protein
MPLLAPFAPITPSDLKDALVKYDLLSLNTRPRLFGSKNKTRLRPSKKKNEGGMSATKPKKGAE